MTFLNARSAKFCLFLFKRSNKTYNLPINVNVGDKVSVERKLTEEDLDKFTELSGDTNVLHTKEPKVYHGAFLLSLVSAVMGTQLPGHGSLVVKQEMRFPHPCYVNQTVTVNVEIVDKKTRFITCSFSVYSQKNKANCLEGIAKIFPLNKPLKYENS